MQRLKANVPSLVRPNLLVWWCAVLSLATVTVPWCVDPAFSIDWSKGPAAQANAPPGAPMGYIHWWAATEYVKEGNCKEAIRESNYLLTHPQFSNSEYSQKVLVLHGECYEKLGRQDQAMRAYLRAVKQYGKNEPALIHLGRLYLQEENPAAAVKCFRIALSMNDKNPTTNLSLGEAYLATGRLEDARESIDRAEELGADVAALRDRLSASTANQ